MLVVSKEERIAKMLKSTRLTSYIKGEMNFSFSKRISFQAEKERK